MIMVAGIAIINHTTARVEPVLACTVLTVAIPKIETLPPVGTKHRQVLSSGCEIRSNKVVLTRKTRVHLLDIVVQISDLVEEVLANKLITSN